MKLSCRIDVCLVVLICGDNGISRDVCLVVLIFGDNGISRDPLDVCFGDQLAGSPHEPMHKGWHTFSSCLSGSNSGALFEVLCVC